MLYKPPVLSYYDPELPITLSVDSSKNGLGAVLLQNNKPIVYASKTLTKTQIAIVYGCQRFHQYLYGRQFTVETDHKPLEYVFKKGLNESPLRLQRLLLNLKMYDFKVVYKPGSQLYIADTLSRASQEDNFEINETEIEAQVNLVEYMSISNSLFKKIQEITNIDQELKELRKLVKDGWPNSKKEVNEIVKPYFKHRHEIVEIKNVLFRNQRIIVPKELRAEILKRLHYNHLGIIKTQLKAVELVYWPNINKEVMDVVKNCPTCLTFQNANSKEKMTNREIPNRPWQIVAADLFHFNGKEYLLIVDLFSKYPEICDLNNNTTAEIVINKFKENFSRHGKPDLIYTDNGPQFVNFKFIRFLNEWEIDHRTSSPRYPQSNGFIERQVQIIKNLMKKAHFDNKDFYLALLEYRNSPLNHNLPSPSHLLFGRVIKGYIPTSQSKLTPHYNTKEYRNTMRMEKERTKEAYNNKTKDLKELNINDKVIVQLEKGEKWKPGVIVKIAEQHPKSYIVKLNENDKCYLRNRRFLRKYDVDKFDKQFNDVLDFYLTDYGVHNDNHEVKPSNDNGNHDNDVKQSSNILENNISERPKRMVRKPQKYKDFV